MKKPLTVELRGDTSLRKKKPFFDRAIFYFVDSSLLLFSRELISDAIIRKYVCNRFSSFICLPSSSFEVNFWEISINSSCRSFVDNVSMRG